MKDEEVGSDLDRLRPTAVQLVHCTAAFGCSMRLQKRAEIQFSDQGVCPSVVLHPSTGGALF